MMTKMMTKMTMMIMMINKTQSQQGGGRNPDQDARCFNLVKQAIVSLLIILDMLIKEKTVKVDQRGSRKSKQMYK